MRGREIDARLQTLARLKKLMRDFQWRGRAGDKFLKNARQMPRYTADFPKK